MLYYFLHLKYMNNNEKDENDDYTLLSEDKLKKLSGHFLSSYVDCLKQQRDMKLTDSELSCSKIFNEHFKYFRQLSKIHDKANET